MRLFLLVFFSLLALLNSAHAQTISTDVGTPINQSLRTLGTQPYTHDEEYDYPCWDFGVDPPMQVTCMDLGKVTDQVLLSASGFRIVQSDPIQFDAPDVNDVPSTLTTKSASWQNCSTTISAAFSDSLSVAFQRSSSSSVTHSVTSTAGGNFGFNDAIAPGINLTGQLSVSASSTTSSIDANSYSLTVTISKTISATVPPQKAIGVTLETWPVTYHARFHTVAVIDGTLNPNDRFHLLSQALPVEQRTFAVDGYVDFADASDGILVAFDAPFDQSKCGNKSTDPIARVEQPNMAPMPTPKPKP